MSFHVGQLVVCVDDAPNCFGHETRVRRGYVYTIQQIIPELAPWRVTEWSEGVLLIEVQPREECEGFAAKRFRPVDDNRLAIFRKALTSAPKHEEVT